jgi:hypothetical protein
MPKAAAKTNNTELRRQTHMRTIAVLRASEAPFFCHKEAVRTNAVFALSDLAQCGSNKKFLCVEKERPVQVFNFSVVQRHCLVPRVTL